MTEARRGARFLIAYALANAGGVIAFLPLLTLFLPLRIEAVAGAARIGVLTAAAILGAVAASVSNIAFGMLSDRRVARGGTRRPWIAFGVAATGASYALLALAESIAAVLAAVFVFQIAVNALLAPLHALMADEVPDAQKGLTGGMLALAHPLASLLSAGLVAATALTAGDRLALIVMAAALCVAPLLAVRSGSSAPARVRSDTMPRRDLVLAWWARLLVQLSGNVLFFYLLYYFQGLAPAMPSQGVAAGVARVIAIGYGAAAVIAVLVGRASDRMHRRSPAIAASAIAMAAGLALMAAAHDWSVGIAGFCLWVCGNAAFIALHTALTMQILPDPRHRGRDLGIVNLTNTLPAILGPAITWALVTTNDFAAAFAVLALLCLASGALVLAIRGEAVEERSIRPA